MSLKIYLHIFFCTDFTHICINCAHICTNFAHICKDLAHICTDFAQICTDFAHNSTHFNPFLSTAQLAHNCSLKQMSLEAKRFPNIRGGGDDHFLSETF